MTDAGSIYSEVRIALDKLRGDVTTVNALFDKMSAVGDQHATKFGNTWNDGTSKATKGMKEFNLAGVAAFTLIGAAVKESISTFAGFEQSMSNTRSVTRSTADDFAKLNEAALKAGDTTRFSAKQAGDAMYYLGSAGWDATQIMKGLDGVLQLAGATQSDLAFTADTVTAVISQFNLKAEDAAKVSNVFAAGIAASQATMQKLAVSMSYVGPVASGMNMTLEDTVGILSILYNNGFEASTAGTALRSTLADLSNAASPAVKKLEELGISYDKVNPGTNSFTQIIENLQPIMKNTGKIMEIFGDRAGPSMIKLLQAGKGEIEKYTKAVTGTQAASEAYATQNDNIAGSLDFLKNAFEGASIKILKEFAPALRMIIDFITGVIKGVSDLPAPLKIFLGIIAGGIPVVLGLSTAFSIISGLLTASAGPISLVIVGLGALVAATVAVTGAINNEINVTGRLKNDTDELKKSLDQLKEIKQKLADKNTTLNATERENLEIQKNLIALRVKADMKKTIDDLAKVTAKQSDYNDELKKNQATIKQLQTEGQKMGLSKREIDESIKGWTDQNAKIEYQQALLKKSKDDVVNYFAELVNGDVIAVSYIRTYNEELARQVQLRVNHLKLLEAEEKKKTPAASSGNAIRNTETIEVIVSTGTIEIARKKYEQTYLSLEEMDKRFQDGRAARDKETTDAILSHTDDIINFAQSALQSFADLFSAIYEQRLNELDDQMQSELEAAGVAEKTATEKAKIELDEAIKSGDKQTIAQKQQALKKAEIEEEYQKKKAKLEYEAAHTAWQMQLLMAIISGAQMVMNAYSSASAIPYVGWLLGPAAAIGAGIVAGVQIGTVFANEPKPPAMATGGIVLPSSGGSTYTVAENDSPELMLNSGASGRKFLKQFAREISNQMGGGFSQNNEFYINSEMDYEIAGNILARKVQAARI